MNVWLVAATVLVVGGLLPSMIAVCVGSTTARLVGLELAGLYAASAM